MKKKIIILGSTGSIGSITINLINQNKKKFSIKLLSTNKNIKKVFKQANKFNVKNVVINDKKSFEKAKIIFKNSKINFHNNFSIIDKLFKKHEIFYSMVSIVGIDGLSPSLKLIKYSKNIGIINKEALICGWNLINKELEKNKTNFFPIDSEHFSIFSLINQIPNSKIDKFFITASGGPFLNYSKKKLLNVSISEALKHPNWNMGKKITVDSSTMMNKVFEVIEAKKIFNTTYKKINILIHEKSYVHSLVSFNNGITKLLIHEPDMKIPIFNSIYNNMNESLKTKEINFDILNKLNFQKISEDQFPLIKLIKLLPKNDTLFETVLVTINDFFVSEFLKKKISYKSLINLIFKYSHNNIFYHYKKKVPKNVNDIEKTRINVVTKLKNWSIK